MRGNITNTTWKNGEKKWRIYVPVFNAHDKILNLPVISKMNELDIFYRFSCNRHDCYSSLCAQDLLKSNNKIIHS